MTISPEVISADGFLAEVIRTARRKTAAVQVRGGEVFVVVPAWLPGARIEALLASKSRWIREKLQLQREAVPDIRREYVSGERFPYLGRNYPLAVQPGKAESVMLRQGSFQVCVPGGGGGSGQVRAALIRWYVTRAERALREKVGRYAEIIGVRPTGVGIKAYRARWGSCDNRGQVQFNWKIIMAPPRIVEYLVVHELCHLRQHNHSPMFWRLVEDVYPDYRECRQWLKQHGSQLEI